MTVKSQGFGASVRATVRKFLFAPTSANFLAMLTTKTGTGFSVFGTGPTITNASESFSLLTSPQEVVTYSATAVFCTRESSP